MREILFRGKNDAGEWLYGYLTKPAGNPCFIIDGDDYFGGVIEETIGQFTGLTDKNGTKIFEGDLIYYRNSNHDEEDGAMLVKFETGSFVISGDVYVSLNEIYNWEIEVIGNIHDNPEFLEGL